MDTVTMFAALKDWAGVIRDIGMIIGVPTIIVVGLRLYDIQSKALEAQVRANESQIKAVEAQNALLRETQYDRALALIEGQKKVFQIERETLERQIATLQTKEKTSVEVVALEQKLRDITAKISNFDNSIQEFEVNYRRSLFQEAVVFTQSTFHHRVNFVQVAFGSDVDFIESRFEGRTSFSGSVFLQPPMFDGVQMRGANFTGADLRGADLSNIVFDKSTKFPK